MSKCCEGKECCGKDAPCCKEQKPCCVSGECCPPLRVVVTGAAGQIGYVLLSMLAKGQLVPNRRIALQLLDIEPAMGILQGVVMELKDLASPWVTEYIETTDPMVAFKDADVAFCVGAFPRKVQKQSTPQQPPPQDGMERKDLLERNAGIFKVQGAAIDKVAKKTIKCLVVGNPANTNALTLMASAPSIPPENFTALTRLDHNRALAQVAERVGVSTDAIKNMIVWGNHSPTMYADLRFVKINDKPLEGYEAWRAEFETTVAKRGGAIIKARKASSALSAANASLEHMRDWILGTPEGDWVAMSVPSDGSYGIPKGLIASFPCKCADGKWNIVKDLPIDDYSKAKIATTAAELEKEKATAFALLGL